MAKIIDHGTWRLTPEDESLHDPGPEVLWNESYYFDFAAPDGSVAGYVRLGLYPNWGRAWYWACVTGKDRPLVLVADNDAPLPEPGGTDIRTGAYTATQRVVSPFGPVRIGLDAEAAVLPDPTAAHGGTSGTGTTRLTFDLRWDTVSGVYPYKDLNRYEIPCTVTGTVTLGDETIAIDASGERDHSWGERDWWKISWLWSSGRLDDGTFFHGMQANIGFAIPWPSFAVPPGGEIEHRGGFSAETRFAADGSPESSHLRVPGLPMTATPLAFAPVTVVSPDGVPAHFPRALCRFDTADGRSGHGWTEWHQPPGWRDHGWSHLAEGDPT
ncbi:hypothetical protein DPM19_24495 [Actinomadura craniellae]|uniref:DUF7064 domain-containing protein n=1 Tax=Actinomadura craniellae TaxID=2231787 RepID=A0A365H0Y8_9ACTN|nr:hypothetical protein [Actinomadura craniellae]RAY12750.1 hypothetical protein DPM19_24495 [Actinomadura craniellae]